MTVFPRPIPIPDNVPRRRRRRRRELVQAILLGVLIRSLIVVAELLGYAHFGSRTLLVEALSTVGDLASSLFLLVCIYLADRAPDEDHPFGHGRYEPLGGLQLGLIIALFGAGLAVDQLSQLWWGEAGDELDSRIFLIPLLAAGLLELGYRVLSKVAKRQQSTALLADAAHFRIDGISSLIATLTLMLVAVLPFWDGRIDQFGALLIALFMVGIGGQAVWENVHQLMDRKPDDQFFDLVRRAALRVEGVRETEKILIQSYGPDAHVNIDIEVDPYLSVELAHEITQKVRIEIQKDWPAVRDVLVHVEPYYPGDH